MNEAGENKNNYIVVLFESGAEIPFGFKHIKKPMYAQLIDEMFTTIEVGAEQWVIVKRKHFLIEGIMFNDLFVILEVVKSIFKK